MHCGKFICGVTKKPSIAGMNARSRHTEIILLEILIDNSGQCLFLLVEILQKEWAGILDGRLLADPSNVLLQQCKLFYFSYSWHSNLHGHVVNKTREQNRLFSQSYSLALGI